MNQDHSVPAGELLPNQAGKRLSAVSSIQLICILVSIVSVFFISFVLPLDERPFYTRGEGREAIVVSDMLEERDFILPFDDISDIPTKPPMFHWMGAMASLSLGGMSEFSIRLPSAICAVLALGATFLFVAGFSGLATGFATAVILGTSFEWIRSAGHARVDMCFAFWLCLGTWSLFKIFARQESGLLPRASGGNFHWWLLATVSMSCAVLAKGPAGVVLPWATAALFLLVRNRGSFRRAIREVPIRQAGLSLAVSIVAAGLWYFLAYLEGGKDFVNLHFLRENVGRFMGVDEEYQAGHDKPVWFGLVYTFTGFLPWSFLFPVLGYWLWNRRQELSKPENEPLLFSVIWFGVFLGIVTISQAKRDVYLLPAFPALAYVFAYGLNDMLRCSNLRHEPRKVVSIAFSGIGAILFAVSGILIVACIANISGAEFASYLKPKVLLTVEKVLGGFDAAPFQTVVVLLSAICFLVAGRACFTGRFSVLTPTGGAGMLLLMFAINMVVLPAVARVDSPEQFMKMVRAEVDETEPLFQFGHRFYSAMYYANRHIPLADKLTPLVAESDAYIIVREDQVNELQKLYPGSEVLFKSETYAANGEGRLVLVRKPVMHAASPVAEYSPHIS